MSTSSRQDYIVRIRYQNTLPPPPCGPKLLKSEVDFDNLLSAGSLSTLIYSQALDPTVDDNLGMPVDLIEAPHSFESSMFDTPAETELDPEDAALLEDASAGVPQPTAVAFLRRTEYSSSAMLREASLRKSTDLDVESPSEQLRKVEESFEKASVPLAELKHPKKTLKAVKSWKFIPDTKQLDLFIESLRMVGSAALSQNKQVDLSREQLASSVFTTSTIEQTEFVSLFTPPTQEQAEKVLEGKRDTSDARDDEQFELDKVQDYEAVHIKAKNKYDEVVVSLDKDTAYYLPIKARINLKRRRVGTHQQDDVNEVDVDELHATRTDVSAEESIQRDQKRSKYDPVSYE